MILHVGHEVTLVEYLYRVVVYLTAFGGAGVVVYWGVELIGSGKSR